MTPWIVLILTLFALAVLTGFVVWRDRRAAGAREQLARSIHAQASRLDRRCDHLQAQLDILTLGKRVSELAHRVEATIAEQALSPHTARRLRRAIRELTAEARRSGDAS